MEVDKVKAFEMFSKGMSANAVAGALKTTWYIASQLKSAWLTEQAQDKQQARVEVFTASVAGDIEPTPQPDTPPASTAPDDSLAEAWDVTLTVPSDRVDDIFATFTTQEKFNAIGHVLQRRLDDALSD